MPAYNPPDSTTVADVPEELAARYEAAGWTKVQQPSSGSRKATRKGGEGEKEPSDG